ncbi:Beta-fructofuranosidase [Penicillium ucsense]|uniref:Beta-fructofuranosidase n=1 Tax=Penicillium ucsense TaxID=2839758 RepID=A0A8J8WN34_9EURO|nr:Beta-fructofuranosidase [Penicillium ucsense]KAF7738119.1 Beta-fructofuranosidase [Penicillium ucsense]
MKTHTFATAVALGAGSAPALSQSLTVDQINSMANNTLFTRWRPTSHFLAPSGWMNDPCGPMYDPINKIYHLHYQFHPNHVNWGNISWGHATSDDLITWKDVDNNPQDGVAAWKNQQAQSLGTTNLTSDHHTPALYNHLGIFSGTAQPVNLTGGSDGTFLAFYTSVSELPTSWSKPYLKGTESQSLAYSTDGGVTWQEYENNPVMSNPPEGWNVTGWRDPFYHAWPEMDAFLNASEPYYYAVFGSGIKEVGPRMPLYKAPASDLTNWTFLGSLFEPKMNSSLGALPETGSYGFNFEVSNFFSIGDRYFVTMGAEGGDTDFHARRWSLWNEGTLSVRANGSVEFTPVAGGAGDWGLLYAMTTFNDTKNNRRIQWGWASEDMNNFGITQQGYQGSFALPRELFIKDTHNVIHDMSESCMPGNSRFFANSNGTWTASTLGTKPVPDVVEGLHRGAKHHKFPCHEQKCDTEKIKLPTSMSHSYQINLELKSTTGIAGLTIAASPNREEYTNIYYNPSNYSIAVDRSHSSQIKMFANDTHQGYFKPYTVHDSDCNKNTNESIQMSIFVDGSLLEVYVNERFALTTRIYPSREDSTGIAFYKAPCAQVEYSNIEIWDGLLNVWPERPRNSSSLLVFDTAAETNNYTWWEGN